MNHPFRISLILGACALGSMAFGQRISADGRPEKLSMPKVGVSGQDKKFIMDLAAGNVFEVQSSELALKNGSSKFVKMFAKMMVADHAASFEELKVVARKKGVAAPKKLTPKQAAVIKKLSGLKGSAFDAAYIKAQKEAHVETAMKLEKQIKLGHDADTKDYAVKTLPAVKGHQKMLATKTVPGHEHHM